MLSIPYLCKHDKLFYNPQIHGTVKNFKQYYSRILCGNCKVIQDTINRLATSTFELFYRFIAEMTVQHLEQAGIELLESAELLLSDNDLIVLMMDETEKYLKIQILNEYIIGYLRHFQFDIS